MLHANIQKYMGREKPEARFFGFSVLHRVWYQKCSFFCLFSRRGGKPDFMRVWRGAKIGALYFEICQTYFEIGRTYFFFAPRAFF